MYPRRWSWLAWRAGAALALVLVGVACGAAQEPTATPVSSPTRVAVITPTPIATPTPTVKEPKYGGIAIFANRGDPPGAWDPMRQSTITLTNVSGSLYGKGNLVRPCRDNTYKQCPGLAESWQANSDFTQWTFKLRDNVFWHDGKPFTAEDAKWWAELDFNGAKGGGKTRQPSNAKADLGALTKVEALDGNRLRITLGRSTPGYLVVLSNQSHNIAHPQHLMQPLIDKGQVDVSPQDVGWVALGAFKMLKYERGSLIQVRKFDKYWEKDEKGRQLPFLDGFDFPIITDPAAMDAALRTGRLDGNARGTGFYLTPERKGPIDKDLGDKVWYAELPGNYKILAPNTLRAGPWQDIRVRRALYLWVDRAAGVAATQGGFGLISTFFSPRSPWISPDFDTWPGYNLKTREQDKAEAKRLMAEAGYPNGFKSNLVCRQVWSAYCEYAAAQMTSLGIQTNIELVDDATNTTRSQKGDYDVIWQGPGPEFPEAWEATLGRKSLFVSSSLSHEDTKVDEFFARLNGTSEFDQRVKIAREMERYIVLDQVWGVFLWTELGVVPYRSYVKGMYVPLEGPGNNTDFATVWMDK